MSEAEVCVILRKHRSGHMEAGSLHKEPLSGNLFDGNLSALFPRLRQNVNLKDLLD